MNAPSDQSGRRVTVRRQGPIVTVTLSDPATGNAQDAQLWQELAEAGRRISDRTRVVVLRGEGRHFCVGVDPRWLSGDTADGGAPALAGAGADEADRAVAQVQAAFSIWSQVPAITIAALHGDTIGTGMQLALSADLRVVADDTRMGMHQNGISPQVTLSGTHALVQLVGAGRAMEICTTGRVLGAAEAVSLGLASLRVPITELDSACRDLADAVLTGSPEGIREISALLRSAATATPEQQRRAERRSFRRLLAGSTMSG